MKDGIKERNIFSDLSLQYLATAVVQHIAVFVSALSASSGVVLGRLLPFGLSIVGGVATPYAATAAAGAAIGALFSGDGAFRYVAACIATAAIKLLLGSTMRSELKPAFSALAVMLVTASTGIVSVKQDSLDIVFACTEAILASSGAYFVSVAFRLALPGGRPSTKRAAALLISLAAVLTGTYSFFIADISIGRVISASIILVCARFGGRAAGAICGAAFGFSAVLAGGDIGIMMLYSFGGLIAGIFAHLNKYAELFAFIISSFVCVSLIGTVDSVIYIVECTLSGIIFLFVPRNVGAFVGGIIAPAYFPETPAGLKKAVTMRLNFASQALADVSQTVEQVAHELAKINAPEFGDVLSGVENDSCKGCTLRIHCWENRRGDTVAALLDMTKAVGHGETAPEFAAPEEFRSRCLRPTAFGNAVFRHYSDYASRISAENRIDEVRSVVSDQFDGISSMLKDLVHELENDEAFDVAAAESVAAALANIGLRVSECCCKIDKYRRMTVEIHIKKTPDNILNRIHIMRQVSLACDRDFDAPSITEISGETMITLCERAKLHIDVGVNQICCSGASLCGDSYNYFTDGKGRLVMILSDGMGSGGRAAVDGAMASGLMSRLLKAGFGYDCSLRILNSSMLFKSTDESLATVDIAVIDLFSGRTDLLKAGAAPTLVRRSGRTGKAESSSLPAGILREIGFDKACIRLKKGDILLVLSDGAVNDGCDWICAELEKWDNGSAQELSEHISKCARRRRTDKHEDDITVMAAIVGKAV